MARKAKTISSVESTVDSCVDLTEQAVPSAGKSMLSQLVQQVVAQPVYAQAVLAQPVVQQVVVRQRVKGCRQFRTPVRSLLFR